MINNPWDSNSEDNNTHENQDTKDLLKKTQKKVSDYMKLGKNHKHHSYTQVILLIMFILLIIFLSTGFFTVDTDEEGIIMRFGKYDREAKPGLNYKLPDPIETVEKVSITRIKKDIIGKIASSVHQPQYLRADTPKQTEELSYPKESQMLTGDENIIDMHFYVQWKIKDAKSYLFNIRDDKKENIVKSAAESVMRQVISEVTLSEALSEKRLFIEQEVKKGLQKIMDSYTSGINIVSIGILYSYVGPEVRDAYRDVQSAKADRERFINQAQAYKNEIIPKAKGEAATLIENALGYNESTVSKAKGEAEKFNAILKSYVVDKEITKTRMYLDTMQQVYTNTNKMIIDPEISKGVLPFLPLNKVNNQ